MLSELSVKTTPALNRRGLFRYGLLVSTVVQRCSHNRFRLSEA